MKNLNSLTSSDILHLVENKQLHKLDGFTYFLRYQKLKKNFESMQKNKLTEGSELSYPEQTVKSVVTKFFDSFVKDKWLSNYKFAPPDELRDPESMKQRMLVVCWSNEYFDYSELLKKKLEVYGWYIGYRNVPGTKDPSSNSFISVYSIEPMFPIDNENLDEYTKKVILNTPNGLFFHVSFEKFKDKILKKGLLPRQSERSDFRHPDERIYLFNDTKAMDTFIEMHVSPTIFKSHYDHTIKANINKTGHTQQEAPEKFQNKTSGLVVFEVDLKKMVFDDGKRLRLFHDNCIGKEGIAYFTRNGIPPQYLKFLETRPLKG